MAGVSRAMLFLNTMNWGIVLAFKASRPLDISKTVAGVSRAMLFLSTMFFGELC